MNFIYQVSKSAFFRYDISGYAHLTLMNDDVNNLLAFSFDGVNIHGVLQPSEGLCFPDINEKQIFIRDYTVGSHCVFRLFSFGNPNVIYPVNQVNKSDVNPEIPSNMYTGINFNQTPQDKGVR
jgi:hypothetical protein